VNIDWIRAAKYFRLASDQNSALRITENLMWVSVAMQIVWHWVKVFAAAKSWCLCPVEGLGVEVDCVTAA
jgi:hypothetical protein